MIRPVEPEHFASIDEVLASTFPARWSERDLRFFLEHCCRFHFGIFEGGQLKSFILSLLVEGAVDVVTVATIPDDQRKGFQIKLFNYIKALPSVLHISLEVDVLNTNAVGLYEKVGFKITGIRKKYYERKRDAYLMVWNRDQ